jgi:hypothetical protein
MRIGGLFSANWSVCSDLFTLTLKFTEHYIGENHLVLSAQFWFARK